MVGFGATAAAGQALLGARAAAATVQAGVAGLEAAAVGSGKHGAVAAAALPGWEAAGVATVET